MLILFTKNPPSPQNGNGGENVKLYLVSVCHDIDQAAGHNDNFANSLAGDELLNA